MLKVAHKKRGNFFKRKVKEILTLDMFKSWMKVEVVAQVAHKKRERTRQQASELKEMQKFLLIKVNQSK